MDAADVGRRAALHRLAVLAGEDGDEPPVARIEIDVALGGVVEIGLLENKGHAEHPLPEVDGGLAIGADQRHVMQTLRLKLLHRLLLMPSRPAWTSIRCAAGCRPGQARSRSSPEAYHEAARGCVRRDPRR